MKVAHCFIAVALFAHNAIGQADGVAGKPLDHWRRELKSEWYRAAAALKAVLSHRLRSDTLPLLSDVVPWLRDKRTRKSVVRLIEHWGDSGSASSAALLAEYRVSRDRTVLLALRNHKPAAESIMPELLLIRAKWLKAALKLGLDRRVRGGAKKPIGFLDDIDMVLRRLGHDTLPQLLKEMHHRDWLLAIRSASSICAPAYNSFSKSEREKRANRAMSDLIRGLKAKARGRAPRRPGKKASATARKSFRDKEVTWAREAYLADVYRTQCAQALAQSGPHEALPPVALTLLRYRRKTRGLTDLTAPAFWRAGVDMVQRSESKRKAAVKLIVELLESKRIGRTAAPHHAIKVLGEVGTEAKTALPYLKRLAASGDRLAEVAGRAVIEIEDDK